MVIPAMVLDSVSGYGAYPTALVKPAPENASILAGTVSALGASTCCLLPLALVAAGVGGAWVAQLRALERFYPVFVTIALGAFAFGFYRLYLRAVPCEAGAACAAPATQKRQRIAFWTALVLAKLLILSPFLL
jgi:mercuric ion transport protein